MKEAIWGMTTTEEIEAYLQRELELHCLKDDFIRRASIQLSWLTEHVEKIEKMLEEQAKRRME